MPVKKLKPNQTQDDDEIDFALAQLGLEWERHDEQRRATFTCPGGARCELVAEVATGGVRVWTVLAKWESELDSVCKTALIRFLGQANARLRFARVVLSEQEALVESLALFDRLELEIPDSVFAVASAYDLIAREVDALLLPEMASQYMEINDQ